jgi:hypothetical protein
MAIIRKYIVTSSKIASVSVDVLVSAMMLTIKAGTFRTKKEDFELLEDEEVTVPDLGAGGGRFSINLVRDKEGGNAVRVLADFVSQEDSIYDFAKSERFDLLHLLVDAKVPEGVSSLDDAEMMLWGIVEEIPNE